MRTRPSYRSLPRVAGPGLLVSGFLARLPVAMAPLGVVMLVSSVTGSFAQAGAVTAALGLGAAAGGPVVGWLSDRRGQRRVGVVAATINAAALVALAVAVLAGTGVIGAAALAAAAGFATPQVGPLARVRWAALLRRRGRAELLPTAMAYEGAADEASYVAGPALVGLLSIVGVPVLPLAVAAALTIAAAVPFAMHPTATAATRTSAALPSKPGQRPVAALIVLGVLMAAIGVVFGATQTGITSLAASVGRPGIAGLVYAALGLGSATAGLATAWLPSRFTLYRRVGLFALVMAVGSLALLPVRNLPIAVVVMVVLGASVAPLLVTVYAVAERITPARRVGTVMTVLASATVAGVALGAGVAGPLAQAFGFVAALGVPSVAACVALVAVAVGLRPIRSAVAAADRVPPDGPQPIADRTPATAAR